MKLIEVSKNSIHETELSEKDSGRKMQSIGEDYLAEVQDARELTIDMDGVLIHDDNAIEAARLVAGEEARALFSSVAQLNIQAAPEIPYCWHAPTIFMAQLLDGLPVEINRAIGRNMRLIPGALEFISSLRDEGYTITAFTAGHQEAAEEVSRRVGIENTVGTQLGRLNGRYNGEIDRFVGGIHKAMAVAGKLNINGKYHGTHIGDSYSDIDTFAQVPNSVAFNPGCELALRNAKISVIGQSLLGLSALFIPKYEGNPDDIPEAIVLMHEQNSDVSKILALSRHVKKIELEHKVSALYGSREDVEKKIARELQGIEYKRPAPVIDLQEFNRQAKQAYQNFVKNG